MKTLLCMLLAGATLAGNARRDGDTTPAVEAGPMRISQEAINHIVNHETGGKSYFTKFYTRPQDPGYASGVTVGFGYDLRFHTTSQIRKDWAGVASPNEIAAMCSVAGMDGAVYRRIRGKVHLTWDESMIVFERTTLPRWSAKAHAAYRVPVEIHPHLAGALAGNAFNRGTSMSGSKRGEIAERRGYVVAKKWDNIPNTFEREQRHWNHKRLQQRRREEAALARKALSFTWWQN